MHRRILATLTASTLLALLVTLGSAGIGSAARSDNLEALVACPLGAETVTFSPGLTFVPRSTTVHVDGVLNPCISTSNPAITNATFKVDGSGVGSCLVSEFNSTMVIDWNSGPDSVIRYRLTVNIKPGGETVFVSVGMVESGQFKGAEVVRTTVEVTLDTAMCLTSEGVTQASGPAALTLVA